MKKLSLNRALLVARVLAALSFLLSLAFTISCSKEQEFTNLDSDFNFNSWVEGNRIIEGDYLKNELIIKVSEELSLQLEEGIFQAVKGASQSLSAPFANLGIKKAERVFPYAGKFEERTRREGLHRWYRIFFDNETLLNFQGVEEVEFIPIHKSEANLHPFSASTYNGPFEDNQLWNSGVDPDAAAPFNDPRLPDQWSYYNAETRSDINIWPVWEQLDIDCSDVIVAVVDHGIDYTHPDLAANIWINEAEANGQSGVDDDGNGYVDDIYGFNFRRQSAEITFGDHGTHVAGTVAAINNNGIGVSGVAGGNWQKGLKGARLMICQILSSLPEDEGTNMNSAEAIKYGADNGAVISQNSWANGNLQPVSASMKAAVDYFVKYAGVDQYGNQTGPMKGGIVIFAAGNYDRDYTAPQVYEKIFAVASVGADLKKAASSNYGDWITVSATGGSAETKRILSTLINNRYGTMSGTSMAAPHVSGVAALLVAHFGGSGFTSDHLWDLLCNSATNIDAYNPGYVGMMGAGLLNAHQAFLLGESLQAAIQITPLDGVSLSLKKSEKKSLRFQVTYPQGANFTWSYIGGSTAVIASRSGNIITVEIDGKRVQAGSYSGRVEVTSPLGSVVTKEFSYIVEESGTILLINTLPQLVIRGAESSLELNLLEYFQHSKGEALSFTASTQQGKILPIVSGSILTINPLTVGNDLLTIKAIDLEGVSFQSSTDVVVIDGKEEVELFPNPVSDYLSIRASSAMEIKFFIYSSLGTLLLEGSGLSTPFEPLNVTLSHLKTGLYPVVIKHPSGQVTRTIFKL